MNPITVSDYARRLLGDDAPEEAVSAAAQAVRNLIQRSYQEPVERQGRADLYDLSGLAAIRLTAALADTRLPRKDWKTYSQWLHQKTSSGKSRIADAVQRARARESFSHGFVFHGNMIKPYEISDDPEFNRGARALANAQEAGLATESLSVKLNIPAAALIRDTINRLGG